MIVNHDLRMIFISNPKVASTSIEAALADLDDEPALNETYKDGFYTGRHMPAVDLREILGPRIWNNYLKFAFVRNPWDWFVSQHFYNSVKLGRPANSNELLSRDEIMETYAFLSRYRGVEWAASASQHAFICDKSGSLAVDVIGRFEALSLDFDAILDTFGLKIELPHVNASQHRYYREYFNSETRQLVGDLYGEDVRIFDYRF